MFTYRAHGKFLITAEYLLLKGAQGLALPLTRAIQTMTVKRTQEGRIRWIATDHQGLVWINLDLNLKFESERSLNQAEEKLQQILSQLSEMRPALFESGFEVLTSMNFSPTWGLGSSSTFVSLLSQWSGVDGWSLQQKFFGGSGYDVACATSSTALLYQLKDHRPEVAFVDWRPAFRECLRFVYLGKKKNTLEALEEFKNRQPEEIQQEINRVNQLTHDILRENTLSGFQRLISEHEQVIGNVLNRTPIQKEKFADFPGAIKSLGAWGGDFVLAASSENVEDYFRQRGHHLIFKWSDLIEEL